MKSKIRNPQKCAITQTKDHFGFLGLLNRQGLQKGISKPALVSSTTLDFTLLGLALPQRIGYREKRRNPKTTKGHIFVYRKQVKINLHGALCH